MKIIHHAIGKMHKPDFGYLILRIAIGIVFIVQGWGKITHIEMVVGFFGQIGFSAWLAYFVAYAEFIGGAALVLGLFTRAAAVLIAIIMAVAVKVLFAQGFSLANGGYEYPFMLMCTAIAIALFGAGKYSLDAMCKCKCEVHR